jgi:hypothetical protein
MTHEERKAKWFALLDEWQASGLSAAAFKEKVGISDSIYKWLAIYRHEKGIEPRSAKRSPTVTTPAVIPPVFIKANLPHSPEQSTGPRLEHPSGWHLQFASNTHPDLITSIAKGLVCS